MKTFSKFMEESDQVLLLQIQEEIAFLEEQLSVCEDKELAESIASRLKAVKRRGVGIAKRAAIAGAAAAALAGGAPAQAANWTADVNVSRGAVPAQATDQSVRGAVDRALANPGQAQSASSEKGKMKTTVSGGINVSGRFGGGGDNKEKKEKKDKNDKTDKKERAKAERHRQKDQDMERRTQRRLERQTPEKPDFKDTVEYRQRRQQNRLNVLQRDNKFKTKYRYAVPSGSGGRFNTRQASGPNQMTDFKAVKTNRTGGTNYQRTKVVGDPLGSGGTGRTVSAKRYDKLFGDGGRYAPKGDGSTKYIPSKLGRKFNPSGYQPNKFVR
jgi:flagellar biosynthesis GTPase FlhF